MFKATHVRTQLPKTIKLNQENAILVDLKGFKFLHSHFLYIQNSKAHRLITLKKRSDYYIQQQHSNYYIQQQHSNCIRKYVIIAFRISYRRS